MSIEALLNAEGWSRGKGMEGAMERSNQLIDTMRKHAVDLPGEFDDLFGIFQTGLASASELGLAPEAFEKLSANAMAAAAAVKLPMDTVAREFSQMLEGRVGSHNTFAKRLGIDTHTQFKEYGGKTFKELDSLQKAAVITQNLERFAPAIAEFSKSYDALSSTLQDNAKQFGLRATAPVFGRIKTTLAEANDWFTDNKTTVAHWADMIGEQLGKAFDWGKAKIKEWWPSIRNFAENAYERFTRIWRDAEPVIERVGAIIKSAFDDPGTFDSIERILKLYIVAQAGSSAFSLLGGVAQAGMGVAMLGGGSASTAAASSLGMVARGAKAVPGVVASYDAYSGARDNATRSGERIAADFGGGALSGAMLGGSLGALLGVGATSLSMLYGVRERQEERIAMMMSRAELERVVATSKDLSDANERLKKAFQDLADKGDEVGRRLGKEKVANADWALTYDSPEFIEFMHQMADKGIVVPENPSARDKEYWLGVFRSLTGTATEVKPVADEPKDDDAAAKRLKDTLKGSGGVHVGRVEISISSNQAPGQIARQVVEVLANIKKHPRMSPYVPTYAGGGT
jgi:hypothetical protein